VLCAIGTRTTRMSTMGTLERHDRVCGLDRAQSRVDFDDCPSMQ
jgi:hypothetical protein